jgi:hypothetical protein
VLVAPNEEEPLLLYIAATHRVVSTVLVVERSEEEKVMAFKGQYIFSVRYSHHPSSATRTIRNLHIVWS